MAPLAKCIILVLYRLVSGVRPAMWHVPTPHYLEQLHRQLVIVVFSDGRGLYWEVPAPFLYFHAATDTATNIKYSILLPSLSYAVHCTCSMYMQYTYVTYPHCKSRFIDSSSELVMRSLQKSERCPGLSLIDSWSLLIELQEPPSISIGSIWEQPRRFL